MKKSARKMGDRRVRWRSDWGYGGKCGGEGAWVIGKEHGRYERSTKMLANNGNQTLAAPGILTANSTVTLSQDCRLWCVAQAKEGTVGMPQDDVGGNWACMRV